MIHPVIQHPAQVEVARATQRERLLYMALLEDALVNADRWRAVLVSSPGDAAGDLARFELRALRRWVTGAAATIPFAFAVGAAMPGLDLGLVQRAFLARCGVTSPRDLRSLKGKQRIGWRAA